MIDIKKVNDVINALASERQHNTDHDPEQCDNCKAIRVLEKTEFKQIARSTLLLEILSKPEYGGRLPLAAIEELLENTLIIGFLIGQRYERANGMEEMFGGEKFGGSR